MSKSLGIKYQGKNNNNNNNNNNASSCNLHNVSNETESNVLVITKWEALVTCEKVRWQTGFKSINSPEKSYVKR